MPPTTSTDWVRAPTSSVTLIARGAPLSSSTSLSTAVLNPDSDTDTVYMPASRAGTSNAPLEVVTAVVTTPVRLFFTSTVAPGTTPLLASTTDSRERRLRASLGERDRRRERGDRESHGEPSTHRSEHTKPPAARTRRAPASFTAKSTQSIAGRVRRHSYGPRSRGYGTTVITWPAAARLTFGRLVRGCRSGRGPAS